MSWQVIRTTSSFAGAKLEAEHFSFYGKTLNGNKEPEARWKKCVGTVDSSLGEALGEAFIEVAFGQESKDMADTRVANVKASLKDLVGKLDWMDDQTKMGAFKK